MLSCKNGTRSLTSDRVHTFDLLGLQRLVNFAVEQIRHRFIEPRRSDESHSSHSLDT